MSETRPTEPRVVRLGIIGTGLAIEKLHWPALRQMGRQFQLTAYADFARASTEKFAGYTGVPLAAYSSDYAELLARDDVDAVLIALHDRRELLLPTGGAPGALDAGRRSHRAAAPDDVAAGAKRSCSMPIRPPAGRPI
jgi:hypothetical protein